MYSNKKPRKSYSVVTRITLWYALVCAFFCLSIFTIVSVKMEHNVRKRADHALRAEVGEFTALYHEGGVAVLQEEINREVEADGATKIFCRLLSPERELLATSNISEWGTLEDELKRLAEPDPGEWVFVTLFSSDSPFHVRVATMGLPAGERLQFGINLHSEIHFLNKIQRVLLLGSLLMLAVSTLFGWLMARHTMAGVQRVTTAVSEIRKDAFDQSVPFGREGREMDQLIEEFNQMLLRIQTLIHEMKEVSDNVAHDLRSPITRMRGIAETTLTGSQDTESYREMGQSIIEECDRLAEMINTTLEIAQAESGLLEINRSPVDIQTVLKNAVDLFLPFAEEKQIHLRSEIPTDPLVIFGDKTRLQRVIANLLDNAIKYTPVGGDVILRAATNGLNLQIEVLDTGPGINKNEIDQIFNRFYRGEKSRSTAGNGLGLSLARTIVQAHGGTLTVERNIESGSLFRVILARDHVC